MEWIDIEIKKPPQNVYVLVAKYDPRPKVKMYFIDIAERIGNLFYNGENDNDDITSNGKCGKVTHWMPIPDPPDILE